MASKGNSGLISRMVSFVGGTTRRAALPDADQDSAEQADRASIQAMMDRKLQNDQVRKREFELLRQLRRHEPVAQRIDLNERTSMFQSSVLTKPSGRAQTIKKIDEIEQQMSQQWWKGKSPAFSPSRKGSIASLAAAEPPVAQKPLAPMAPTAPAQPALAPSAPAPAPLPTTAAGRVSGSDSRAMPGVGSLRAPEPAVTASNKVAPPTSGTDSAQSRLESSLYDDPPAFGASEFPATMLEHFSFDPATEDAAIQFANGDFEAAAKSLLEVIRTGKGQGNQEEIWLSLFDLYRSIGDRTRFDSSALDFAAHYGRSAPQWGSSPPAKTNPSGRVVVDKGSKGAVWAAPAKLDKAAVERLKQTLEQGAEPWSLNWAQLHSIDSDALDELGALFAKWCQFSHRVRFLGAPVLDGVLATKTQSGNNKAQQNGWLLRLNYLRLVGNEDAFERVALDFCITYEVSPPAWEAASSLVQLEGQSAPQDFVDSEPLTMGEELISTLAGSLPGANLWREAEPSQDDATVKEGSQFGLADFVGEVTGDAASALERLTKIRGDHDKLVVDCRNLVRVDFVAAGNLLNWATRCTAEGCKLEFKNVNRLVATFLSVVGIDEFVRIIPPAH